VSPDGGAGWDEPPLDIQIPDDARELDRDVLAYHRELRARRRRRRLRRLASPFSGQGAVLPVLASILAVCLVAGAMLSVATFSPPIAPSEHSHQPSATASAVPSDSQRTRAHGPSPAAGPGAVPPAASARTARANPSSLLGPPGSFGRPGLAVPAH
jgi:hypothetical protein